MHMLPSVSTSDQDAVIRQIRWCAAIQTLVNCHCQLEKHPVGDVEPVKFVVQYLTQPGDDAQQHSTHAVTCPLLSLVYQQAHCYSNQSMIGALRFEDLCVFAYESMKLMTVQGKVNGV